MFFAVPDPTAETKEAHPMRMLLILVTAAVIGLAAAAAAAPSYDDEATAEGGAWKRIRQGAEADLGKRDCAARLAPNNLTGPNSDCHKISAKFIEDVLTDKALSGQITRHGFRLSNAIINGTVDLRNAAITAEVAIDHSRIEKNLALQHAHLTNTLSLQGTVIDGSFVADGLRVDDAVFLTDAEMDGLYLRAARIDGDLNMGGATFHGPVNGNRMTITGSLFMDEKTTLLNGLDLITATIDRIVRIAGSLRAPNPGYAVRADGAAAGGDFFLGGHFEGPVRIQTAHIAGNLDLRGTVATVIDLAGTAVAGDVLLGEGAGALHWRCQGTRGAKATGPSAWPLGQRPLESSGCEPRDQPPRLVLRNARVGGLPDNSAAWPADIALDGFKYDHIGALEGPGNGGAGGITSEQWGDWLSRSRPFSPKPYTQLANVLQAGGDREAAEAIQYASKSRETDLEKNWGAWLWLSLWRVVAGYGVGFYTFRVLWWVIGFAVLGTAVLGYSPAARARGWLWRFGASLHRLLPIVELDEEFNAFFENPLPANPSESRNRKAWQQVYFALSAMLGWLLLSFLLAAIGSLGGKG